ncbi:LPP20 family lipoprotein [Plastorhodobacter daqingensis]|uniref:LPP20 family lipoprotein n=1 Tax=Plastorhodobacter daqingensis TaxID=1387281 RepID=A0ABW2UG09_9RHOB
MPVPRFSLTPLSLFLALPLVAACSASPPAPQQATDFLPADHSPRTRTLAEVKDMNDMLDAQTAPSRPQTIASLPPMPGAEGMTLVQASPGAITGLGFAVVSSQPGQGLNQKRLMAIKAARMEAMRDLTEQIHGLRIDGYLTLQQAMVRDDRLTAAVSGSIRGARTVRITPKGADSYEVLLELDQDTIGYLINLARGHA